MTIDDKFDEFWEAYPSFRRDARKRARDAFGKKHVRAVPHDTLMAKVREFAEVANKAPPERRVFVPQITTWLNQGRWDSPSAAWETSILGERAGKQEVKW